MLKIIEKLFFPGCCCLCDSPGTEGMDICFRCLRDLPENTNACLYCAIPITHSKSDMTLICGKCIYAKPNVHRVIAPYIYAYPTKYFIQSLKFNKRQEFARLLGTLMAKKICLQNRKFFPDALLPVPLHINRYRNRGFNQSDLIAKYCGQVLKTPVIRRAVTRVRDTPAQTGLNRKQRLSNLESAFTVSNLNGVQHVAIIDDVLTTGSTVNELVKELTNFGINKIEVWVFARAVS